MAVTMTRRAILGVGAAGTVGAASLALGDPHRTRRWLHAAGVVQGPDAKVPDARPRVEEHGTWAVAVPSVPPEAIVLCLHGRNESHAFAFDAIGVHRFVATRSLPWIVAAVDGGASSYWHHRADGRDPTTAIDDVLDRYRAFPVLLLGWSMGGYGALLLASTRPDSITAVAATSPALWRSFRRASPGAFDSDDDFRTNDVFAHLGGLRATSVRIDCGADDPFAPTARELVNALPNAAHSFGSGFHDAGYWRSRVEAQLDFFEQALRTS
jgi:pimeloyl-ACP methyl ester carboxylesterase